MSIIKFIKKICVQSAVYWSPPTGEGVFGEPREIKCRWQGKDRIIYNNFGDELVSKADVLITEVLEMEGWLYLGTLANIEDLSGVDSSNPMDVPGAYKIIAMDTTPLIKSTTEFVRTIYLGFKNV